jgi:broad specificity phosphatase PhoE
MTRIILVRHGQTEWNRIERFRGRADMSLNWTGLIQALATGRRIATAWQPTAIYSSPLSRAAMTAESIGGHLSLPVHVDPALIDIDYGEWQGLTPDQVRLRWPETLNAWYQTPQTARIPSGETLDAVRARTMNAVNELALRHIEQTIVLVSHTITNRVILLAVLGLGNDRLWRLNQDTCAVNVFEIENGEFTLVLLNDTCHLNSNVNFNKG